MKNFRIIAAIFALIAMMNAPVFAQNNDKTRCDNEQCVLEILKKLNSNDEKVIVYAEKTLDSLAQEVIYTGSSDVKYALFYSILQFVEKFPDGKHNDFLFSLLPKICNSKDAVKIFKLFENELLADKAIRTLGDIPGTKDHIEKYIIKNHDNLKYKASLAYAVGKRNIRSLENELVSWIKTADYKTKLEIYKALVVIGSDPKTMQIVEKGAKKLYKSKDLECKIGGMQILTALKGEKALPILYKALKNDDARVRRAALELMKPFADDIVAKNAVKKCKKGMAVADVLDWLGDIKNNSQMVFVITQLDSENSTIVNSAIRAVFKIDDPDGINAVKPMFGGDYQDVIKESMMTYEGDFRAVLEDVIKGNDRQKLAVLQIIEGCPTKGMMLSNRVKELINSGNQEVRDKAYKVLRVVAKPADAEFLMVTLELCSDKYVEDVQLAIKNAAKTIVVNRKDDLVSMVKRVKPEIKPRYYKVYAWFGTEFCIDRLIDAYKNDDYKVNAKEALLMVENEAYTQKIQEALK